ncbi:MAG: PilZ domain-containing protein [Armatimonadetes bacterium]|nr:PilZ domain-containing protein [Armatimonadota bacterium]
MKSAGLVGFLKELVGSLKRLVLGEGADIAQKREMTRLSCEIPVHCETERRNFPGTVVDLGVRGMRLQCRPALEQGEVIAISYHGKARFNPAKVVARVRWVRKRSGGVEAGIEYLGEEQESKTWVDYVLEQVGYKEASVFDRRRSVRASGAIGGTLVTKDGGRYEGAVANLGIGGALLETRRPLSVGMPVTVRIGPGGKLKQLVLEGKVRHSGRSDTPEKWLNGVSFVELTPETTELLGEYLFLLIRESVD